MEFELQLGDEDNRVLFNKTFKILFGCSILLVGEFIWKENVLTAISIPFKSQGRPLVTGIQITDPVSCLSLSTCFTVLLLICDLSDLAGFEVS